MGEKVQTNVGEIVKNETKPVKLWRKKVMASHPGESPNSRI